MSLQYNNRPRLWESEQVLRANSYELTVVQGSQSQTIALQDIAIVRVTPHGQFAWPAGAECELVTYDKERIIVRSMHQTGLWTVEDRSQQYAPFVQSLVEHIALANPQASFVTGRTWAMWTLWCGILLLSAMALSLAIWVAGSGQLPWQSAPILMLLGTALPLSWRIARDGTPREFHPLASPRGVLPG